jgi:hypothetical protein
MSNRRAAELPRLIARVSPDGAGGFTARRVEPRDPRLAACGRTHGEALDALVALAQAGDGDVGVIADLPRG